jgi:hypothetical protein
MNTNSTSIGRRTGAANLRTWTAIHGVLFAMASIAACGPAGGGMAIDGGTLINPDSAATGSDAAATSDAATNMDAPRQPAAQEGGQAPVTPSQTCTVSAQCPNGFCVDGICCDRACDRSCESCALTGKVGTCSPIKNATDDTCGGDSICDETSTCRKSLGGACALSSECASGNCVDGVCCGSAACGTCQSCALLGSEGTCALVPKFTDDADSGCSGQKTCDGLGACRSKNGTACGGDNECTSLHCVDTVCCNDACDGTCYSCNQQGSAGTCKPLNGTEDPSAVVTCAGSSTCTAAAGAPPACKVKDGEPCASNADCFNGSCMTSYRDGDGDGYGQTRVTRCQLAPAAGYVLKNGDCCDSDPGTKPGISSYSVGANTCGGFDWNCDGKVERSDGSTTACGCVGPAIGKLGGGQVCTACR